MQFIPEFDRVIFASLIPPESKHYKLLLKMLPNVVTRNLVCMWKVLQSSAVTMSRGRKVPTLPSASQRSPSIFHVSKTKDGGL